MTLENATPTKSTETAYFGHLISPVPDTDLRDFLQEVDDWYQSTSKIGEMIDQDLDAHALKKKRRRMEDRAFLDNQTADLAALELPDHTIDEKMLTLQNGRPRMPSKVVFLFLMLRGFLTSLTSKPARLMILESISLQDFFDRHGFQIPGQTTTLENVNAVSQATLDFIMDNQIQLVNKEELDDFKELTIDSTAVKANSAWPTDGKMLIGLLERSHNLSQQLHTFELKNFSKGCLPRWIKEMHSLEFEICLKAGKPNSKIKMKKNYRKLLEKGNKAAAAMARELENLEEGLNLETLLPSRREMCARTIEQIRSDISDAKLVAEYAYDRIFHDINLPSTEKILSLSDGTAAYIQKGGRNAVIGYKPQLVRSANGFITSLIVPEGNAADSIKLEPAIRESIQRTGVIADLVSTDDGYSSIKGRDGVLTLGVNDVSISGAKGKKITAPEDWESDKYQEARRNRSAVESLMYTIKNGFGFGELGRRGIEAVRQELTEKVLAYNCCRILFIRKRRKEEQHKEAEKKITPAARA